MLRDVSPRRLLDALDGVAYIVRADGVILGVGEPNWSNFANRNGWESADAIVGRNIYEGISGEDVQKSYRNFTGVLTSGTKSSIEFLCHCDGPETVREMRVAMTPISLDGATPAVLYQCHVLSSSIRPPVLLFDGRLNMTVIESRSTSPIVTLCSYCNRVACPESSPATARRWVRPAEYYGMGGTDDVRVSHGICPDCYRTIVAPQLGAVQANAS